MLTPELTAPSVAAASARRTARILALPDDPLPLGPEIPRELKARNERRLEAILDRSEAPGTPREPSRSELETAARRLGATPEEVEILCDPAWRTASRRAVRGFRREIPELGSREVQQALRNAWVCFLFQDLVGVRPRATGAVRAYSLLYPLTDNLMDDGGVSRHRLGQILCRLGRRLALGSPHVPASPLEVPIWRQLDRIDAELPPHRFPQVRAALGAIHRAQVDALLEERAGAPARRLLELACAKGGTSVLTDAVLVRGSVDPEVREFAFSYGVLLQLLDDFEDRLEDEAAGRRSWLGEARPEREVFRLWRLVLETSSAGPWLDRPSARGHARLAVRSSRLLLLSTIARDPGFEPGLAARLEAFSPVRFGWIREQEREARDRGLDRRLESLLVAA